MNEIDSNTQDQNGSNSKRTHRRSGTMGEERTINNYLTCPPLKMLMALNSPSFRRTNANQPPSQEPTPRKNDKKFNIDLKQELEYNRAIQSKRASSIAGDSVYQKPLTSRTERPDSEKEIKDISVNYKHILLQKDKEIERLQSQVWEMQKNTQNKSLSTQRLYMLDSDIHNSFNTNDFENIHPQKQKEVLHGLILKSNETFKMLKERYTKLNNLIEHLETSMTKGMSEANLNKIKVAIEDVASTLVSASNTEIELGIKTRDNEKKTLEIARHKMAYDRLQSQYKHMVNENVDLKRQKQELETKILNNEKQLLIERNNNAENIRKISIFEKRIELILEADVAVDRDKLRKAITELVKENDNIKRVLEIKDKECKKQVTEITKLQNKISRLKKKIETLSKIKKGSKANQMDDDHDPENRGDNNLENDMNDQDLNLLHSPIPLTLDFRTSSLKLQYINLLNDLFDKGAYEFVNYYNGLGGVDEKKQILTFVSNQLINMREFSDKLHFFIKETLELHKCKDVTEIQILLSKYFKIIFSAQTLHLWVPDGLTGIFYTINASHETFRCLATKGLINEVIRNRKAYNKRNLENTYICELTSMMGKYKVNNTILLPIKKPNGKVMAVLEISNNLDSHFGFDEEYFASLLSHVLAIVLQQMNTINTITEDTKVRYLILETFVKLTECKSKFEYTSVLKRYIGKVFGVATSNFIFVEKGKFVRYSSETEYNEYETNTGFSGQVYQTKKLKILSDMSSCREYNGLVDLYSVMPLYFVPIIAKDEVKQTESVVGILQLVVKTRGLKSKAGMDDLDGFLESTGADEPIENLLNIFSSLIATSLVQQKNFTIQA